MKRAVVIIFFLAFCSRTLISTAQQTTEQQLEELSEKLDHEIEDDDLSQQLVDFKKHQLNLNTAQKNELAEFPFLTVLQIENLIAYRKLFGQLLSIYELQAVPGWDLNTIRKMLPYIMVGESQPLTSQVKKRIGEGEQYILLRCSEILEKSKGYEGVEKKYPGSPQKIFLRYQFRDKNLLRFGLTAEKDAGEQFFKGKQKTGFDFYSFHLYASNLGKITAFAIGDFTINLGQGLIQWQSFAFKKSSEVISIKRQAGIIRPYNSSGEFYFSRGMAISINQGNFSVTGFASRRKLDANIGWDSIRQRKFATSFVTSGYHRTENELADKNSLQQLSYGGNLSYHHRRGQLGLNFVNYLFSSPIQKKDEPYNLYALSGKSWNNLSIDYNVGLRNLYLFGEVAADKKLNHAWLTGLIMSVDPKIDISLLGRFIGEKYQTVYGNAFTENNLPSNENGIYAGVTIRPAFRWQINFYADLYKFPWLKFESDAPAFGKDFLIGFNYQPKKDLELTARFKTEMKETNKADQVSTSNFLEANSKQNLRLNINYFLSRTLSIKNRIELLWYEPRSNHAENGFLGFFDLTWKPPRKNFSSTLRLQFFESDSYNSRIYAYENDVLYSYSIPSFFDQGWRYYFNIHYEWRNFSCCFRYAQIFYKGMTKIGSGYDEINGNKKTELKFQLMWTLKNDR